MQIEAKIKELGINLPKAPKPVAEYIPAKIVGNFSFLFRSRPNKRGSTCLYWEIGQRINFRRRILGCNNMCN